MNTQKQNAHLDAIASAALNYYDHQPAHEGDKMQISHFGTCRIDAIDYAAHVATVRNTCTGEVWELDDLSAADLIERANINLF